MLYRNSLSVPPSTLIITFSISGRKPNSFIVVGKTLLLVTLSSSLLLFTKYNESIGINFAMPGLCVVNKI